MNSQTNAADKVGTKTQGAASARPSSRGPAQQARPRPVGAGAVKSARATSGSSTGGLLAVLQRNLYYKDQGDKTQWTARVAVGTLLLSCAAVFFAVHKDKQNAYFATSEGGVITKLVPLSQPNQSNATVSNWTERALVDTFDFHYGNYKSHLNEAALSWYTKEGAAQLVSAMQSSGNLDAVVERQMFVSLTLKHNPIVIKEGIPPGSNTYAWKLQAEGIITYTNTSKRASNNVLLTIVVTRRSLLEEKSGLGIAKILMKTTG